MKIALIGAGPSGMAQLVAFASAEKKGTQIPEIVCFEKQSEMSGLWNYTWRTGTDEHGYPQHASMYRDLWSNGPKECLEMADYTFDEHYGVAIPSYPPRLVLKDYIVARAKKHNIDRWIRYNTLVKHVDYDEKTEKFTVLSRDLIEESEKTEEFDRLIVAPGHFSAANVPAFDGFDTFDGTILHAHDFRDAREYTGRRVLIIGSSYSAEDIGSQCYKFGATDITFCYRYNKIAFEWPACFTIKPNLQKVEGKTAFFQDGSSKDIDVIILCTGYKVNIPFLSDKLRISTVNRLWPEGLYNGCILLKNPKVAYLGFQDQYYTFTMFDAEAWYVRDVLLGKITLPPQAQMQADYDKWKQREEGLKGCFEDIDFQTDFVQMLCDYTDYPTLDTQGVRQLFYDWEHLKDKSIMGYRDHAHRSVLTGTMGTVHPRKWLGEMNDSIQNFVDPNQNLKN